MKFFCIFLGWGLKALSVFITVKIKIVLLLLFLGGGIFYGLKIWQGTALGCPEPIIQEVIKNHHDHDGILPYHGLFSADGISSYPGSGIISDSYGPPPSLGGPYDNSFSGVYSNTPAAPAPTYSGPSYLPPTGGQAPSGGGADGSSYNRRRARASGRQVSEESVSIFGDLVFRFLDVKTDQCRRRFVCELEFRNPFMGYAMKYLG